MPDIDITKIITASGGKIWDELSEYLEKKALISQGERKRDYEQQAHNLKLLKKVAAKADAEDASYRIERVDRQRERSGER